MTDLYEIILKSKSQEMNDKFYSDLMLQKLEFLYFETKGENGTKIYKFKTNIEYSKMWKFQAVFKTHYGINYERCFEISNVLDKRKSIETKRKIYKEIQENYKKKIKMIDEKIELLNNEVSYGWDWEKIEKNLLK
jgi:hypothetical protein